VLNDIIRILTARALFEGPIMDLNLRVAWAKKNDEIHSDLTDSSWKCVQITNDGWSIIPHQMGTMFTRFNQKAQVEPDRNYQEDIFDQFLDLIHIYDHQRRILNKVWIISAFIPEFPHPIDIAHGEKGSLKSTLCRYKKRLIDPDKIELLTIPKDKSEFVQQLYHNYLGVYDNVRYLPPWFSDEACRAITGAGNSKRGLYTNDEDVIYNYKRCLMVNGINNVLTEPDALDRCILSEYDRLKPEQRREEAEVDIDFEQIKPKLLGYTFDILVKALEIKSTVKLTDLPRMADFAAWGETISRAIGYDDLEFINAYYDNIGKQNVEAVESNPLAQAMDKFVDSWYNDNEDEGGACWQGPPSKALESLNETALIHNINTNSRVWPKAPNSLTRRLTPILSNLREGLGIDVVIGRITTGNSNKKNTTNIRVRKIPPLPPPHPLGQNHAQIDTGNGGGNIVGGDIISTIEQVSPQENGQNRALNLESGGSGDSGDTFGDLGGGALPEPKLPPYIRRIGHSDKFSCDYCRLKDDKWGMANHFHSEGPTTKEVSNDSEISNLNEP
jgi:hypothetical protein